MDRNQPLHYYYERLDPAQITVAREKKGLTKKKLAELIGKGPSAVTQFENGKSGIAFETFCKLIEALGVSPKFLAKSEKPFSRIRMETCHFRANRAVPQTERVRAIRYAEDVLKIYCVLENRGIAFPEISIPVHSGAQLTERQMEQYALSVRSFLGLGLGPIQNMAELLESVGIRIVLLPMQCAKMDACSTWFNGTPCIMVDSNSPNSRMQFDYGHEFAHLLLHEDHVPGDLLLERVANRFASAFLLPQASFFKDCPDRYRLGPFLSVKKHWQVSIKAAIYRARQLGKMTERNYTNALIGLSKQGYNKEEPGEEYIISPIPTMLREALELLSTELTINEIAEEIDLSLDETFSILREQRVPDALIEKMTISEKKQRCAHLRLVK